MNSFMVVESLGSHSAMLTSLMYSHPERASIVGWTWYSLTPLDLGLVQ